MRTAQFLVLHLQLDLMHPQVVEKLFCLLVCGDLKNRRLIQAGFIFGTLA
jgi:hypothetical protein